MALNWETIEDAIWTWLKAGTGLPDDSIIWADQNAPQENNPVVMARIAGPLLPLGAMDSVAMNYDPSRPEGQEIELRVMGHREMTVYVQAYTDEPNGSSAAMALLSNAQIALALPTVRDGLRQAGLAPFDTGRVMNLSALDEMKFEGRASLDVRFYVADTASEFTTWIETVEQPDLTLH
jgi:hypothetical protein